MANGASRIFNVVQNTAKGQADIGSRYVNLSVRTLSPLTFTLDDKIIITPEFYTLDKNFVTTNLQVNEVVSAISLNNNQLYYILDNTDYNARLNALEARVSALENS